jgi:hypothetical protein
MDSLIHEILHAALWDLDEEAVTETANAISAALWRVGYRRPELKLPLTGTPPL